MKKTEIWKLVPSTKVYEASNLGRVRHVQRKRPRTLKSDKGYLTVCMKTPTVIKHRKVHRLVAEAFLPNPENKPEVNHKNGIKSDNRVENLEWATPSENRNHGIRVGLIVPAKGVQFNRRGLTEDNVRSIRKENGRLEDVGKKYGISRGMVWLIRTNKSWRHVV